MSRSRERLAGAYNPAVSGNRTVTEPDAPRPSLWIVRHGATEWSGDGRHTGSIDIPLTEEGRAQARMIAPTLAGHTFAEVLTSPRSRAEETSRLAGFGDRARIEPDLSEWDYGEDEGRTTAEIQKDRPGWSIWRDGPRGGESIEHVAERTDRVIALARAASGDVLIFSHGHLLRILGVRWVGLRPLDGRLLLLDPATVSVLGGDRGTPVIEHWNQEPPGHG
jgi:broad specificity phosphatase PhoE